MNDYLSKGLVIYLETPLIFISHITEEKELAKILKDEIENAFMGLPKIFVSSDGDSINVGAKWLEEIDDALKKSQIILLLCSKNSVIRPWINFEAGAGWVKGIPIVPICHTNLRPIELPIPLNMLQGIEAKEEEGLAEIFKLIGKFIGIDKDRFPNVEYSKIVSKIREFEQTYGVTQVVKHHVNQIVTLFPALKTAFFDGNELTSGTIPLILLDKIEPHLQKLQEMGFLEYGKGTTSIFTNVQPGIKLQFNIHVKQSYYDLMNEQ